MDFFEFLSRELEGKGEKYVNAKGLHVHECPNPSCKTRWEHPEHSDYEDAHHCPKCGTKQLWKAPRIKGKKIDYKWKRDM